MPSYNKQGKIVAGDHGLGKEAGEGNPRMIRTYRDIRYTLKRSNRKTASIYVERGRPDYAHRPRRAFAAADREGFGREASLDLQESGRVARPEHDSHRAAVRQRRGIPLPRAFVSVEAGAEAGRTAVAQGRLFLPAE